jgi:hypothetical protein
MKMRTWAWRGEETDDEDGNAYIMGACSMAEEFAMRTRRRGGTTETFLDVCLASHTMETLDLIVQEDCQIVRSPATEKP